MDKSKAILERDKLMTRIAFRYGDAIVGWVDDNEIGFYQKNTAAKVIPGSHPRIYKSVQHGK
jgi:hypothetical protein